MQPKLMVSKRFELNIGDVRKIVKDTLWFALVPLTFYITQVLGDIGQTGHILTVKDFIPSNTTLIAVVSWALNQVLNTIRKFLNGVS